ncbi:V-type ATP synthase subunit D [Candidatus Uabimicrobium sp. HlEnr_7]|uniref:V-type ATP synthase subunit D n=1 Tax=Candidatus Uabimicrobium helgolandensis TaxID=3095367 RepID=UPI0035581A60
MAKIKLTRNELKAQKESLKRFARFLPTLELKKLQLELERRKVVKEMAEFREKITKFRQDIKSWQNLFCENYPKAVQNLVRIENLETREVNIAGISVTEVKNVTFAIEEYDLYLTSPWLEKGIEVIKDIIFFQEREKSLQNKEKVILQELRKTTQRINLFKEKLIPECKENIRMIRIQLGDLQAAAVGRSKMAKQKMQPKGGTQ